MKFDKLKRLVDPTRPITYGIVQAGPEFDGGVPYIRPADMTDESGVKDLASIKHTSPEIALQYRRSAVRSGDLVISIGPSFGKVMEVPSELDGANLTQGTARVAPGPNLNARFAFWCLRSHHCYSQWEAGIGGATFRALNLGPLAETRIPNPDLATQRRIADFLDRETARIDLLIEKKQRLVALLGEKRQSGIVSAVTLGLNERVDLKDTGVSWVPHIPKHWELRKIKHLGRPIIGLTYAPDDLVSEGEGTPVLRANNIQAGKLQSENLVFVSSAVSQKLRLREGDILICSRNGSRNLIGKNAMVSSDFRGMTFGAFNTVLRSKYSDFLYWVLQSPIFDHQAGSFLTSTINQLTISTLSNLVVPFATLEEQEAICKNLRERERIFDASAKTLSTSIDRLKECRSALITAAVTGQIDVTTYAKSGTPDRRLDAIQEEMGA